MPLFTFFYLYYIIYATDCKCLKKKTDLQKNYSSVSQKNEVKAQSHFTAKKAFAIYL